MKTYEFWRERRTGEVWAIELLEGAVVGCCAPLDHSELDEKFLEAFDYSSDCACGVPKPRFWPQISLIQECERSFGTPHGRDREHAHAPSRGRHDEQGEQDAEGVRDDDAAQLDVEADLDPERPECLPHHEHHPVGDGDPEQRADDGRGELVGDSLEAVSYTHLTLPTTPYV